MATTRVNNLLVIGSVDATFSSRLGKLVNDAGLKCIRTNKVDRIIKEMKKPGRVAIIDMSWEDIQNFSVLRQIINIGAICDNKVICISPNREEELKTLARRARPYKTFLRFDLEGEFREQLNLL